MRRKISSELIEHLLECFDDENPSLFGVVFEKSAHDREELGRKIRSAKNRFLKNQYTFN